MLAKYWKWLKQDLGLGPRPLRPGEMLPGVVRPSYALAGLVAGKMLADPSKMSEKVTKPLFISPEKQAEYPGSRIIIRKWSDEKMFVKYEGKSYTYHEPTSFVWTVEFSGKPYADFTFEDLELIKEAWRKTVSLKDELEQNKRKAEAQQKACDIIQSIFSTPVQEDDRETEGFDHAKTS